MFSTIKACFARDNKKFWVSTSKEDSPQSLEPIKLKNTVKLDAKESEGTTKGTSMETSFNSKNLSSDEESPQQKIGDSFLSVEGREDFEDYFDLVGETESLARSEEEKFENDSKIKAFSKSDWEKTLDYGDLENTSTTETLVSLRHGIPFELRPRIWEFLANTSRSQKKLYAKGLYEKLASTKSKCESIIRADIHRTFSTNPFFKYKKYDGEQTLLRVLRAYANFDRDIGYTQGMNVIAGALLIILHPETYKDQQSAYFENYSEAFEEKAFWMLVHLMYEKNWRSVFRDGTPKLIEITKYFEKELSSSAPEIFQKIVETNLSGGILFNEMFVTLLLMNTPLSIGKRILDIFLIEGEKILFKVILRALVLSKERILNCSDDEELNMYIRKQMFEELGKKYKKRLNVLFSFAEDAD